MKMKDVRESPKQQVQNNACAHIVCPCVINIQDYQYILYFKFLHCTNDVNFIPISSFIRVKGVEVLANQKLANVLVHIVM